ncbi:MAG TPA: SDR family oxidoreductase [Bacteroidota bacterium]|nr:SDR family oxidoreductase [Bacteroidota bacterium]
MGTFDKRIVLVTGASSGIGLACAEAFARQGARLVLAARRKERLEKLAIGLKSSYSTESFIIQLDVRHQPSVENAIRSLPPAWQDIEVLVNNAGLSRGLDKLFEGKLDDWEEMLDTNVKGLLYVSRAVVPGMVARGKGTIVNLGSIAGHEVYPGGNVYCASKHAVDALTKGLRMDLVDTPIRVCTVDPGLVETEFSMIRFRGNEQRAKAVYQNLTPLTPADVADAVLYCASAPAHVQIAEMIILPTNQASSTLVHRTPAAK